MAAALLVSVGGPSFNRQLPKQFPGRLPIAASPTRPRARGGLKRVNALTAISSPAGARSRPAGVSSSVVVGGRPLWFAFRTQLGLRAMSEKCHVWTAPGWQGLSSRLQHWSVRPCVRPVGAVHMTAGHNVLRKQIKLESESIPADICLGLMIRNWAVYRVCMKAAVSPMSGVALLSGRLLIRFSI